MPGLPSSDVLLRVGINHDAGDDVAIQDVAEVEVAADTKGNFLGINVAFAVLAKAEDTTILVNGHAVAVAVKCGAGKTPRAFQVDDDIERQSIADLLIARPIAAALRNRTDSDARARLVRLVVCPKDVVHGRRPLHIVTLLPRQGVDLRDRSVCDAPHVVRGNIVHIAVVIAIGKGLHRIAVAVVRGIERHSDFPRIAHAGREHQPCGDYVLRKEFAAVSIGNLRDLAFRRTDLVVRCRIGVRRLRRLRSFVGADLLHGHVDHALITVDFHSLAIRLDDRIVDIAGSRRRAAEQTQADCAQTCKH